MDWRFQAGPRRTARNCGATPWVAVVRASHKCWACVLNVREIDFERFLAGAREVADIACYADDLTRDFAVGFPA